MSLSRIARSFVLFNLACLILLLTLDNMLPAPFNFTRWLIQVLPLAAFLPAMFRDNLRPYQWLCFLILFYFTAGILTIFTPGRLLVGVLQTLCCVLLFSSAIFYIRKQAKAASPGSAETPQ